MNAGGAKVPRAPSQAHYHLLVKEKIVSYRFFALFGKLRKSRKNKKRESVIQKRRSYKSRTAVLRAELRQFEKERRKNRA